MTARLVSPPSNETTHPENRKRENNYEALHQSTFFSQDLFFVQVVPQDKEIITKRSRISGWKVNDRSKESALLFNLA